MSRALPERPVTPGERGELLRIAGDNDAHGARLDGDDLLDRHKRIFKVAGGDNHAVVTLFEQVFGKARFPALIAATAGVLIKDFAPLRLRGESIGILNVDGHLYRVSAIARRGISDKRRIIRRRQILAKHIETLAKRPNTVACYVNTLITEPLKVLRIAVVVANGRHIRRIVGGKLRYVIFGDVRGFTASRRLDFGVGRLNSRLISGLR